MSTLLDELVVQGIRQSASQAASKAIAGGISGTVSKLASQGGLGNLTFNSPALKAAVAKAQAQMGTQPSGGSTAPAGGGGDATDVAPITVMGNPGGASPAGALGQVLSGAVGSNTLAGGAGTDQVQPQDQKDQGTEVDPITVTGNKGIPPAAVILPAGAAGLALLGSGGGTLPTTPVPDPATIENPTAAQTIDPNQAIVPTAAGVGGAAAALAAGAGAGGILGTGITAQQLAAGATVASALGAGNGGSGGANSDAQKALAANASGLADRLGGIATAGMSGNIGGMGLNSIDHMVRKAQAAVRQRYASMGMSGSSAETADLQAAADAGVDLQFKIGQEMASTGLNAIAALTGQSAQIYAQLMNAQTAKDTALGNALANFAAAVVK